LSAKIAVSSRILRRFSPLNCGMQLALEFCAHRSFRARLSAISFEASCSVLRCSHAGRLPEIMISKICSILVLSTIWLGEAMGAQPAKTYRIGVLFPGGAQYETLNGLREGLKELALEEGKQFVFVMKDTKGEAAAAEEGAKALEQENVSLIYALTTPVITTAKAATTKVPIVFTIGSDPVTGGLVDSFPKPGGRLTGVHYLIRDLTAKRLEILK
jgi:ABC-type uncharacterized transport system substrate-binding protein